MPLCCLACAYIMPETSWAVIGLAGLRVCAVSRLSRLQHFRPRVECRSQISIRARARQADTAVGTNYVFTMTSMQAVGVYRKVDAGFSLPALTSCALFSAIPSGCSIQYVLLVSLAIFIRTFPELHRD